MMEDITVLYLTEAREKTFKKWPFNKKNKCNVHNMAKAGFYSVATGDSDVDAVKCFLCGKELDGWEAQDDPWEEHKSHASQCAYVQLAKQEDDLKLSEFASIMRQYSLNCTKQMGEICKAKLTEKSKSVRRIIAQKK